MESVGQLNGDRGAQIAAAVFARVSSLPKIPSYARLRQTVQGGCTKKWIHC